MSLRVHNSALFLATAACLLLAVAGNAAAGAPAAQPGASVRASVEPAPTAANSTDHSRDFDFLRGYWYVRNRRLLLQLQGSSDWVHSDGTLIGAPLLEGMGNYDELRSDATGAVGVSIRFINKQTSQWSDYWVAHRDGVLQPAVFGTFVDGVGTFDGKDVLNGKSIRVR